MRNKILALVLLLVLSGCATREPTIKTVIQRVEVPISVPCKATVPPEPDFNFKRLSPDHGIYEKTRAILADRKLHIGYEIELLAALNSCIK